MKKSLRHWARAKIDVIWIPSWWLRTLTFLLFFQATPGSHAQQLTFANPVPSTQLRGGSLGTVKLVLLNTNGSVVTNSSAPIVLRVSGPGNFSLAQTNQATNGEAAFSLSSVTLNQAGLYSLAATSSGSVPAFENIGVEATMMPPQSSIFAGAWANPVTTNGPQNLAALEQSCGRTLLLSMHYYNWTDSTLASASNFTNAMAGDAASNRIPVISWHGTYLTNIVAGTEDTTITNAAKAMAAFQGPILVRWFWEMNLHSTSSSTWQFLGYPSDFSNPSASQVAAAQTNFVAAWKHIRNIFDANGAANVIWLWNPGAGNDSAPGQIAGGYTDAFYPGDAYVDWIGLDAYNRLDDAFANTFTTDPSCGYPSMTAHAKPLLIGETGAYYTNESHQITFLDSAASVLQTNFPQLLGFMYFDAGGADDWSLSTLGATNGVTEFGNLVNNAYLSAAFAHPLNYSQFHPFSARVHIAPAVSILQGGIFDVGVSVDNLYSHTPSGTVDIYSDTNLLTNIALTGGSNGYCQVQMRVTVTNAGAHSLVAVYSGDTNNSAGQSWPAQVNVLAPPLSFRSIRALDGTMELIWNSVTNLSYQIQFSTNLPKGTWTSLGAVIVATNCAASATDDAGGTTKFYRITTAP